MGPLSDTLASLSKGAQHSGRRPRGGGGGPGGCRPRPDLRFRPPELRPCCWRCPACRVSRWPWEQTNAGTEPAPSPRGLPERQLNHKTLEGTSPPPQGWGQEGAGLLPGVPWVHRRFLAAGWNPVPPPPCKSAVHSRAVARCHGLSQSVTGCPRILSVPASASS